MAGQSGKSSEKAKELRARSYRTCEQRKELHVKEQRQREMINRERRKAGQLLPWELACAARAARREGMYAVWAKAHPDLALEQKENHARGR